MTVRFGPGLIPGEYAVELDHVTPAWWPERSRLRHELPALYWA